MRLGQLARKLSLRQAEIIQFLATQQIQIEEGSNTKLEDAHVNLVIQQFAPGLFFKETMEVEEPEKTNNVELARTEDEQEVVTEPEEEKATESIQAETVMPVVDGKAEVIKAAKVELPGLKVVGKIELPEPKKKETPVESETTAEAVPEVKPRKSLKGKENNRQPYPTRKNPIALQREREAQLEEKRRKAEAKREKEKRTQYYLKRVTNSAPTKSLRIVNEPVEHLHETVADKPKTLWGRFLKWLYRK